MAITVELFDGTRLQFPDDTSKDVIDRVARQKTRELQGIKPESGGGAAFKAGIQNLLGAGAALAGRVGLRDVEEAQRAYEARKQRAEEIFQPNPEGWNAPVNKLLELAGGSLPYMPAPLAAGAAAAFAPVTGAAATALGLGAAGLASTGQFTATNLARQLEEGKRLQETDLAAAAAAAVPQALLDTIALRMMPGVGRIFGQAGVKVTKENAEAIAKQALSTTLKDYAVTTGKTMTREGVTEAAQQALERLQAGLNITDPQARAEYFESFVGGAVLGGAISPAGRFFERGSEQRQARRIIEDEASRVAQEQRAAEEARKQTPEYLEAKHNEYAALVQQKETLRLQIAKAAKGKPLSEEEIERNKSINEQLNALAPQLEQARKDYNAVGGQAAFNKLTEERRVAGLTPLEYQMEQFGVDLKAPAPEQRVFTGEDFIAQQPAAAPELQYAAQQVALANEREFADQRDRKEQAAVYVPYLMQDMVAAFSLVKNNTPIPNVSPSVSNAILSGLKTQFTQLGKDIGAQSAERAAQQKAVEKRVGVEREGLQRIAKGSEAAREYFEGERKGRIEDARLAAASSRMTSPIQEQRELFGPEGEVPEATSLTRTYVPSEGEALDRAAITELVKQGKFDEARAALAKIETAPASDADKKALNNALTLVADKPLNPADRALVEQIQDNFDSFTKNAKATRDAVDYFYKDVLAREGAAPTAPEAREQSTRNIQARLAEIEAGKRSETEQQTQLARRRIMPEERAALYGTSLGPRTETGVVEETEQGDVGTAIASTVQKAKIGTPVREATSEIVRAVQTELPFTDRRDEPIARSAVAFNNWRDFSDYLGSAGLQMLRSTSDNVKNKQFPNIHRAGVLVQNLLKKADGIRQQALAIAQKRKDIIGSAEVDADTANKMLQEAYAALEKGLASVEPIRLQELVNAVNKATANLDAAQKLREQLLVQLRDNVDKLTARVDAYEEATNLTTVASEADEVPIAVTGAEAQQARDRQSARKVTKELRDNLAEAISDLISLQRWQANAQKSVNFIDENTSKPEKDARRKALTTLTAEVAKQRNHISNLHDRLISSVAALSGKVKAPTLPDKVFKDFLVEEAKLTDLINEQTRRINVGLRLAVNNARLRLNNAYVALENEPQTAALRQTLRQQILQAEQLDRQLRGELTARREVANSTELVAAQQALTQKANEQRNKAQAAARAAQRLAAQRLPTSQIVTETQADREARDAEKRKEEQARLERAEEPVAGPATEPGGIYAEKPLEGRQKEGAPIPRTQVIMEVRRKIRQSIEGKVDQLTALRDIAEDPESTLDERVEATNEFAAIYKKTKGGLEKLDAKITNAINTQKALTEKISNLREQLAQESVLSENQKTRYKNKPEVLAEKEEAKRDAIRAEIVKLLKALSKTTTYLSANRGIERVRMPTKAERAAARTAPREVEDVLTPTAELIAKTQTTGRQVGPVVKKGTVPPEQLRTGTEESRTGVTKTSTRNKLRESNVRGVPVGVDKDVTKTAESLIKQLVPLQTELTDINRRLDFIKNNPTNTEKQKTAKAELVQRKNDITAQMTTLRKQLAEISKDEKKVSAEFEKSAVEKEKKLTAEETAGVIKRKSGPVLQSRGATTDPSSVASLRAELGKVFPDLGRVQMYESVEALIAANPQYEGRIPSDARGFVDSAGNKAFLIAENIDKGQALGVLLHEVGAHVGLKNTLGDAQYNALVNAVKAWEKRNDGSTEAKVAQAARRKVEAAETKAAQVNDELLAYAVEEAVNANVKPFETKSPLGQWLTRIAQAFRKVLEKFGLPPKALDAQALVDMAFGAAKMEMTPAVPQMASIVEKNGAYNIPLTRIINAGDETSSPWLLADGRVVGTGQDHLSVIDAGSFSEHMQNTGDIRAMFARSPDGKEYTIALHMAEGQKPTKAQIQTVLSIFKARENKNTKLIIGETNKAVNPEYNEFSLADFKNKYVGSAADDLLFSRAVAQKFPVTSRVIDATVASQRTWKDDVKDNLLNFRTQYLDKLFPAEQALKLGGVAQKVATQAMYYLRMYDYRMHMTSQAAFVGAPDLVEKTRKDGSKEWVIEANKGANIADAVKVISTKEVANAAGGADNAGRMLTMYMAAIRGERVGYEKLNFGRAAAEAEIKRIEGQLQSSSLSQEARSNLQKKRKQLSDRLNTLPTEADFKAIRAEVDANETLRKAFNEAREIYNQYNRNLLNFVVKTGAISRAKADEWIAQGDYVPYYRMRDGVAELMIGDEAPIRIGNLKDSPHLEKLVGGDEPIMNFLDSSVQNTAMLLEMGMHNLAMRNLMFELQHVGLAKISKETKRTSAPEGAVTFKMDGNDHFAIVDTDAIGVDSELLVKGLAGIPTMLPTVTKLMGIPARILRKMVLASPVYWGRQLVRDSTAAALASGADMLPVIGALKQIGKPNVLEARGITGGQVFTGMPEDMADILRGMQRNKISLSGGLAWLEAQSAKADALTRKAQYDSYIEQGMSEMEATLMAMESMNFARRGLSPSLHMLSTVIPFFNAQLQGLDVLYRSFTGQMPMNEQLDIRRKLLARGMLLFGMSMMYAFLMQDDETYKNAKPEEKYGNWFVPLPGTDQKLRVPIPFELGYIFKALPEALVNSMMSEEGAEDAVKAFTHILQQTIPGGSSYMLPQAIKPGLEVLMGTSMYTGRGIESGREQQIEAGYRVRESTTEAAAWLGEATGFSPIKMEYLIRGYTAGVGIAFLQALSLPMARSGPERAERRPSDLPVVGTLFQPSDASGIIDATYERMQELAQKEDTYKRLLKEGRTEAAAEYLEKNAGVVGYESLAGRFRQQMGKITDYERKIRASDMTPQEKRQRLDEMRDAKIRLAAAYRDALKGTKDQGYRSGMGGSYGGAGASASF